MKKTLLAIFTVMCVVSCGFLDVPLESTVATSNYYRTTDDFDMCLTGRAGHAAHGKKLFAHHASVTAHA